MKLWLRGGGGAEVRSQVPRSSFPFHQRDCVGQMVWRSKRHVAFVAALLAGSSLAAVEMAQAQQGPFVYVPNVGNNNVSVIDTSTNTTVPPAIAVGTNPQTAAVRGDESLVYVTNPTSNTVSVINTCTNTVTATISGLNNPAGIAVSPDGTRAYVT